MKTQDATEPEEINIHRLKLWLLGHESDIAVGLEDFGGLYEVFVYFIGREPRE